MNKKPKDMSNQKRVEWLRESKNRQLRTTVNDCEFRLADLQRCYASNDNLQDIMDALAPIRVVTILEVFAKKWMATIIDRGSPYQEFAALLFQGKKVKIDFSLTQAIRGKEITFGDLLANELSWSSIENIIKNFTDVLGEPFADKIQGECQNYPWHENMYGPNIPKTHSVIFKELKEIFDARHILTHELPTRNPINRVQIISGVNSAISFVLLSSKIFSDLLDPNPGVTQSDMNDKARYELKDSEARLAALLRKVKNFTYPSLLYKSQVAWKKYRKAQAILRSNYGQTGSGSIAPWVYFLEMNILTENRIEQLNWWLERVEGEF